GERPHPEELRAEAALAHARQVEVPEPADSRRRRGMAPRHVVAELLDELDGVGVEVEDRQLVVERPCGGGVQPGHKTSKISSAASTRSNGGMMYAPATRCLTAPSASCAMRTPSRRAAGPEPTSAMRARMGSGIDMPGTCVWMNSALRCDASGRSPIMT